MNKIAAVFYSNGRFPAFFGEIVGFGKCNFVSSVRFNLCFGIKL